MTTEDRLKKLEGERSVLQIVTTLLGVMVFILALLEAVRWTNPAERASLNEPIERIRAKRFDVVDDNGEVHATLSGASHGGGMLALGNVAGRENPSVMILGDADGIGWIWLYGESGQLTTWMTSEKDCGFVNVVEGGVQVWNTDNKRVALLVNSTHGDSLGGFLAIADALGNYVDGIRATKKTK